MNINLLELDDEFTLNKQERFELSKLENYFIEEGKTKDLKIEDDFTFPKMNMINGTLFKESKGEEENKKMSFMKSRNEELKQNKNTLDFNPTELADNEKIQLCDLQNTYDNNNFNTNSFNNNIEKLVEENFALELDKITLFLKTKIRQDDQNQIKENIKKELRPKIQKELNNKFYNSYKHQYMLEKQKEIDKEANELQFKLLNEMNLKLNNLHVFSNLEEKYRKDANEKYSNEAENKIIRFEKDCKAKYLRKVENLNCRIRMDVEKEYNDKLSAMKKEISEMQDSIFRMQCSEKLKLQKINEIKSQIARMEALKFREVEKIEKVNNKSISIYDNYNSHNINHRFDNSNLTDSEYKSNDNNLIKKNTSRFKNDNDKYKDKSVNKSNYNNDNFNNKNHQLRINSKNTKENSCNNIIHKKINKSSSENNLTNNTQSNNVDEQQLDTIEFPKNKEDVLKTSEEVPLKMFYNNNLRKINEQQKALANTPVSNNNITRFTIEIKEEKKDIKEKDKSNSKNLKSSRSTSSNNIIKSKINSNINANKNTNINNKLQNETIVSNNTINAMTTVNNIQNINSQFNTNGNERELESKYKDNQSLKLKFMFISLEDFKNKISNHINNEENYKNLYFKEKKMLVKRIKNMFDQEKKSEYCLTDQLIEQWDKIELSYENRYKLISLISRM